MLDDLKGSTHMVTTRWSLLAAIRQGDRARAHHALSTLYRLYSYPLYHLALRLGWERQQADDAVQGFFTRQMEDTPFERVDRQRGRFRRWLQVSFQHYLANERVREHAQKRGGGQGAQSLETLGAQRLYSRAVVDRMTPERLYTRAWALHLLSTVRAELRNEYADRGYGQLFDMLEGLLTGEVELLSYQEVAEALGMTPGAVKEAALRLRRRFVELLRARVSEYCEDPADVDRELRELLGSLSEG